MEFSVGTRGISNRYPNLRGSTRAKDVRRMTISATGNGDRNLIVSYISGVPVSQEMRSIGFEYYFFGRD